MNRDKDAVAAQAQIRDLIEARVRAVEAKDIEALMANHAPDVLSFDVIAGESCTNTSRCPSTGIRARPRSTCSRNQACGQLGWRRGCG